MRKRAIIILLSFIFVVLMLPSCSGPGQKIPQKSVNSQKNPGEQAKANPSKQINIEDWHFSFELPSEKWSLKDKQEDSENNIALYRYIREWILDSKNRKIIPNIGIVFEKVPKDMDVIVYSLNRRGFKAEKMFTHLQGTISLENAIGYIGKYTNSYNIEHTAMAVYAIHKGIGAQIIMDATTEVFPIVESEFNQTLKTLKFAE